MSGSKRDMEVHRVTFCTRQLVDDTGDGSRFISKTLSRAEFMMIKAFLFFYRKRHMRLKHFMKKTTIIFNKH